MTLRLWRRRRGSALLTVLVLIGIAATVTALSLPAIRQADRLHRVKQTAEMLEMVRMGITDNESAFSRAFRQRISRHPGRLSQLTYPIEAQNAADFPDSCGARYLNPHVNSWNAIGPFTGLTLEPGLGLVTPIGIADNELERDPAGGGAGTLELIFPDVDVEDVILLDAVYDEGNGRTAIGAVKGITWDLPNAEGLTRMRFRIVIDASC